MNRYYGFSEGVKEMRNFLIFLRKKRIESMAERLTFIVCSVDSFCPFMCQFFFRFSIKWPSTFPYHLTDGRQCNLKYKNEWETVNWLHIFSSLLIRCSIQLTLRVNSSVLTVQCLMPIFESKQNEDCSVKNAIYWRWQTWFAISIFHFHSKISLGSIETNREFYDRSMHFIDGCGM